MAGHFYTKNSVAIHNRVFILIYNFYALGNLNELFNDTILLNTG